MLPYVCINKERNNNNLKQTIMTTLEAVKFAAQIKIGSRIKGGMQVMIVTEINNKYIKGYSEYAKIKYNKESEMILEYDRLLNSHYNKNFQILD